MDDTDRRIVLLGKTGTGKSSLANTIFGVKNLFKESHRSISETNACESKSKNIDGKDTQLIDTPGVFDTDPKSTALSRELLKCVTECAPGPHAFLIVLKVERYTRQEQAMVDVILKYFTEEALRYTTVVFTHGDQLQEGVNIKDWARENEALRTLLEKCGGRCHVFDNKYWNNNQDEYRNNQVQVRELLKTIDRTVEENGGRCYTNEMLQKINDDIQQEATRSGITLKDLLQEAKRVVYVKLMTNMEGAVVGVLLGALLGAGVMVQVVLCDDPTLIRGVALGVAGTAMGGATGALGGAYVSGQPRSPTEIVRNVTVFLSELERLGYQWNQTRNAFTNSHAQPSASTQ